MNPKKRWLLHGLFEEEQKRSGSEELARPIQWNDDEQPPAQASAARSPSSRSRSPTTWSTAATLVELRSSAEASPPSSSAPVDDDQPLNLSISSSRS